MDEARFSPAAIVTSSGKSQFVIVMIMHQIASNSPRVAIFMMSNITASPRFITGKIPSRHRTVHVKEYSSFPRLPQRSLFRFL